MRKLLKTIWSGRVDSNHRPPGPEPGDSHFGGFCAGLLIFHIVQFSLCLQSVARRWFCMVCAQLRTLVARKGQEKGKVFGTQRIAPSHRSDPPGLCGAKVLKKLTKPGALMLSLSSTYSAVRLIDAACRSSVSATNLGSRS